MDDDNDNEVVIESKRHGARRSTEPKPTSTWCQVLSTSFVCILIVSMSFIFVNLVAITLQWIFEGRRLYSVRQVHQAIFDYYKQQFYLWYLTIRNWNCHKDGKIKVIIPNYLAS